MQTSLDMGVKKNKAAAADRAPITQPPGASQLGTAIFYPSCSHSPLQQSTLNVGTVLLVVSVMFNMNHGDPLWFTAHGRNIWIPRRNALSSLAILEVFRHLCVSISFGCVLKKWG